LQLGLGGYEATLSDVSIKGGVGGPQPDPLSQGTGYLFYRFWTDPTFADTATKVTQLQNAIWWLEEEITSYSTGNPYIALLTAPGGGGFTNLDAARRTGLGSTG